METQPPPESQSPRRRIELVDGLRGFALLGILLVNIAYFSTAYLPELGLENPRATSWLDDFAENFVTVFFTMKFYILFSFLFGYSFILQTQAAERTGAALRPRILRRSLGLYVLGWLHALFLWHGDILTLYAASGLILYAMRTVKAQIAVIVGAVLTLFNAISWATTGLAVSLIPEEDLDYAADAAAATVGYRGSFWDVFEQRLSELPEFGMGIWFGNGMMVFAAMLFGLAAAKSGLLSDLARFRPYFKRALAIGLPVGILGSAIFAATISHGMESILFGIGIGSAFLSAPFLTAAYVSAFALGASRRLGAWLIGMLAPVGRMALSNYILQSVLMGFIFFGYGFGLFGEVGPFTVVVIALAIFAAQIIISSLWMSRHTYGPLEWLLRAFTYWQKPAWRKQSELEQPALDSLVSHPPHTNIDPDRSNP